MHTSLLSAALSILVTMPSAAFALTIAPMEATSSTPARATVQSPTSATTESGEKGGTEDINIGVGELQESGTASSKKAVTNGGVPNTGVEPDEIDVKNSESSEDGRKKGNVEMNWKVEEGESAPGATPDGIDATDEPQKASTDYLLKLDGVKGESTKAPGVEPDEIDVAVDPAPLTPDFSILLGGGSGGGSSEEESLSEETRTAVSDIVLKGMQEQGAPAETMSFNYEKIKFSAKQKVKFLGFIPMDVLATVEIDATQNVEVKFPWWSFLVSGKDGETLGQQIFTSLSNVLKTKHDTVKNAIGNVR